MKKIFNIAVFTLISMSTVWGQSNAEPSAVIASEFGKQFSGATNVIWEKTGAISYASFHLQQNLMIAYFDRDGKLIAKARKINTDQLPMGLQSELLAVKNDREKKSGFYLLETFLSTPLMTTRSMLRHWRTTENQL
jgi:hypothetical protein